MAQQRRLIFLDIDGTLTEGGTNDPPASALEAVRQARAGGHLVALCSGRNLGMLSPVFSYGFDGAVCSAGGYIFWGDKVLYDCPMTEEQRVRVMDVFARNRVARVAETRDNSYVDQSFSRQAAGSAGEEDNSELIRWRRRLEENLGALPMDAYDGAPLYKLVFMCLDPAALEEPRRMLEAEFQFCIQGVNRFGLLNGELINRRFNKGAAIRRVCAHLGIPLADTVAFGDSMNDVEMLETAGLGVCMGNGSGELKKRAKAVCPPIGEDGLYRGFQQCGLI